MLARARDIRWECPHVPYIYARVRVPYIYMQGCRQHMWEGGSLRSTRGCCSKPGAPQLPSCPLLGPPRRSPTQQRSLRQLSDATRSCSHMVSVVSTWHLALFFLLLFRISSLQLVLRTLHFSQSLPNGPGSSSPQLCALHLQAAPVRSCVPLSVPPRNWISSGTDTWPLHPATCLGRKSGGSNRQVSTCSSFCCPSNSKK